MIKNNKFDQRLAQIPSDIWSKIIQIDELKGQWIAGAQLSSQVLGRLKRSILITSSGASTRIEGSKLSEKDIERMIRGIDIQKFADRDKQEVRGYYELLENVFNSWESLKFSESIIKYFHKELLKYVEKDALHRGEYKKRENKVVMINAIGKSVGVLFDTTPAYLTPKEMQELVEWTQTALAEKKHQSLLIIGNFLVEFLNIHPFQDGNGRLSRILTNFLLLKAGYLYMPYVSHEKLVEDNKPEYYIALRKSQKTTKTKHENIIIWLDFFLTILLKQSRKAIELLSEENIENLLSKKQLSIWRYIQEIDEVTISGIIQKTNIARSTVKQVLNKLLRLKKIKRIGLGRGTRYRRL